MRRLWLIGLISEVHIASRQTYGSRRIHAELTIGMKLRVRKAPGGRPDEQSRYPRPAGACESETVAWHRHRRRPGAPQIPPALTERTMDHGYHRTSHERKQKSTAAPSWTPSLERSSAGRSIMRKDSTLVVNALDVAIKNRQPTAGGIVHADHGVQFTSWAFTNKIRSSGLMPSFGTIGDCYDNAMTRIVLVERADRASEPEETAHPARLSERDLRLHRDLLQPSATPFSARLSLTSRARVLLHTNTHISLIFTAQKITKP